MSSYQIGDQATLVSFDSKLLAIGGRFQRFPGVYEGEASVFEFNTAALTWKILPDMRMDNFRMNHCSLVVKHRIFPP